MRKKLGGEQQESGADTLSTTGAKMLADFGDGANGRNSVSPELALNRCQIVAQQLKNFFGVTCSR